MRFRVELTRAAVRQVERLPARTRARILDKLDALAENPRPPGGEKPAEVARDIETRGIPLPPLLGIGSTTERWTNSAVLELRMQVRRAGAGAKLAEYVEELCFLTERLKLGTSKDEWVKEDLVRVRKAIADLQEWLDQKKVDRRARDNSEQRWIGEKVIPFEAVVQNRDLILLRARRPEH